MFDVGAEYNIVMLETGDNYEGKWSTYETSSIYEVAAVDGSLVKLLGPDFSKFDPDDFGGDMIPIKRDREVVILNTNCLFFVRAEKIQKSE